MTDFLDAFPLDRVLAMRAAQPVGPVQSDDRIFDGVYFSWGASPSLGKVTLTREPGAFLSFDAEANGEPAWFTLNLELGDGVLEPGDLLTVIIEGEMSGVSRLPMFVRSGADGVLYDTRLKEPLDLQGSNGVATLFHTVADHAAICGKAAFHTLVIELPMSPCHVTLRKLRILRLPARRGLRGDPPSLSSIAS